MKQLTEEKYYNMDLTLFINFIKKAKRIYITVSCVKTAFLSYPNVAAVFIKGQK